MLFFHKKFTLSHLEYFQQPVQFMPFHRSFVLVFVSENFEYNLTSFIPINQTVKTAVHAMLLHPEVLDVKHLEIV
ncbi:hypothetical protein D5R40_20530 [Okeania hirsuta]|uniref:Uncharacterized protein n=1 Tax=Okeania hirsuta TaxID=1458930 RepID=A0A3N6N8R3_9CYAN|nr:hypothetical protein D4Z78_27230 [Okeania hirsuta]RQH34791.1 hypothetical protein D5R40_20530 [Okeania hirsuta]